MTSKVNMARNILKSLRPLLQGKQFTMIDYSKIKMTFHLMSEDMNVQIQMKNGPNGQIFIQET